MLSRNKRRRRRRIVSTRKLIIQLKVKLACQLNSFQRLGKREGEKVNSKRNWKWIKKNSSRNRK
jgi:hypothetical protein